MTEQKKKSRRRSATERRQADKARGRRPRPDLEALADAPREKLLESVREMLAYQAELEDQCGGRGQTHRPEIPDRQEMSRLDDFAEMGYVTLDQEGVILQANSTTSTLLRAEAEPVGSRLRDLVAFPDRSRFDLWLEKTLVGESLSPCRLRLKRTRSGFFHARLDAALLPQSRGGPACRLSIVDVSQCKRTEGALQEQQNILKLIFELIPGLHSYKDRHLVYRYVNPAFCAYLGLTEQEIVGKTDFDLLPAAKARKYRREDLEVLRSGRPLSKEEDVSTPLFGLKIFHIIKNPLHGNDGKISGLLVSIRDVTEKKKTEEKLRQLLKLESLGILAGGIAHDFNNLLTGILGNIELAKMLVGPEARAFGRLEQAERASLSAKHLTMQLLTFSRGGVPAAKTSSVGELIQHSTEFTMRGTNVRVVLDIPDDLGQAAIDEGQISQVVQNLVKNAEQAMPEGGELRVRAANVRVAHEEDLPLPAGDYIKISVEDTGQGIPARHLERIFDPYFTTKQKGTGLGLAICHSIIKQHHGHLEVRSSEGEGTTFFFLLPVSRQEEKAAAETERKIVTGQGRILFMDDEELIKDIAGEMLRHLGYEATCVGDGLAAIKAYIRARQLGKPFDLVMMDLTIPGGLGGRDAIRKLLEIDPEAKVIAASGYTTDPVMINWGDYGFRAVVQKPFNIQELGMVLHQVLQGMETDESKG